ncbi:hypothetical protein UFOVP813_9 [uncultured Caudovirales phage]|uniref:Uncharacterized protein n=1 Tax=uncultured Caudovirales phage TaxID=2100421 RepID=A0A6J5P236_9CAUD|nr:hypothetical protein UFOVP813_9 [uncultured Caudovirales phage]
MSGYHLAFVFGSLFGASLMCIAHLLIARMREREQREELVSACSNTRRLAYASGYNDGKLDIQRGARA